MLSIYFGSPGCGKTTLIAKTAKRDKSYKYIFTNVELSSITHNFLQSSDLQNLGSWTPCPNSLLLLDEAGIEYNNRKYKSMSQSTIAWFKLHRHFGVDVNVYSQSWDDVDITLRRLADRYFYLRKIGCFTLSRRVYKTVMVDDVTHQIIDGYRMERGIWLLLQPLRLFGLGNIFSGLRGWGLTFRPFYYKYFNTHSVPADVPALVGSPRSSKK